MTGGVSQEWRDEARDLMFKVRRAASVIPIQEATDG